MAMAEVGFIGLGVMGGQMAAHLLKQNGRLIVWNRSPDKAWPLGDLGAFVAGSLEDVGERCQTVFLCVNRTEDVRQCLHALTSRAAPNSLYVDHSTISPVGAKEIHGDLRARGFGFVDAPITGGSMGAQKGQLTIFCGGEEADIDQALPLMKAYARRAERVGGPGAGQMMKMVNQIAVGGALLALCEALSFAKKAGLDLQQTKELVGSGAAGSWAFENYGPKILAEDWSPGFTVENQRKDFAYVKEAAAELNAAVPGTDLVDNLLARLQEEGGAGWTTAALYETLLKMDNQA
jgi:3-hydroxyisobutyrate dehydrogenase